MVIGEYYYNGSDITTSFVSLEKIYFSIFFFFGGGGVFCVLCLEVRCVGPGGTADSLEIGLFTFLFNFFPISFPFLACHYLL